MSSGPVGNESGARLAERARQVVPGGVNSGQRSVPGLTDLVVTGTDGARFRTADGREYTDFHSAFGPPLLGHNDPDVARATARPAPPSATWASVSPRARSSSPNSSPS